MRDETINGNKIGDSSLTSSISSLPDWLNIAIGYGAENMYGGFENEWESKTGGKYHLEGKEFKRYRQYYVSLDVDWNRIKTDNLYHKTLAIIFNSIKVPSPTLEISEKGFRFHWLFF